MRINTNVPGLRILNQMARNNRMLDRTVQRLSTGLRVNSAADDAVAMARGQRLTAEINGMRQTVLGIGMKQDRIKTADGALNEVQSAIHRMRELAVYAASDTITDQDREYIQFEIEELTHFIGGVIGNSHFNKIKLFQGDLVDYFERNAISKMTSDKAETEELKSAIGDLMLQNCAMDEIYTSIFDLLEKRLQEKIEAGELPAEAGEEGIVFDKEFVSVKILKIDDIDLSTLSAAERSLERMNAALSRIMSYETIGDEEAKEAETQISKNIAMNDIYRTVFDAFERQEAARAEKREERTNEEEDEDGEPGARSETERQAQAILTGLSELPNPGEAILRARIALESIRWGVAVANRPETRESDADATTLAVTRIAGDDAEEEARFGGERESGVFGGYISGVGAMLSGLDMTDRENAAKGITVLDKALDAVSRERASLGAQYNALEHRKDALEIAIVNAEETKSRLLDADIAQEMMNFARLSFSNQINNMLLKQTCDIQARALNLFF